MVEAWTHNMIHHTLFSLLHFTWWMTKWLGLGVSWPYIVMNIIIISKWPLEFDTISKFIHQVNSCSIPIFYPKHFKHGLWYINVCILLFWFCACESGKQVSPCPRWCSKNLLIPLVSTIHSKIPFWNRKVDDYIASIFYFAEKFLAIDGAILLFHLDDLWILNEVRSYLESYRFQIWMKWAMVNSLPFTNSENPSIKVPSLSHIHWNKSCPLIHFKLNKFPFYMIQMVLNKVTLLVIWWEFIC